MWIPSHVGIHGNEMADQEARQATTREWSRQIKIRPGDLMNTWKKRQSFEWQNIWDRECL